MRALACVFMGMLKLHEGCWMCMSIYTLWTQVLSSVPFLFAQQLFHPSEWPLHSSAVFFLGGRVSYDPNSYLIKVNFLSRHGWWLHPLVLDLIGLNLVINSRRPLCILLTGTVCWFLGSHKGQCLQRIKSYSLKGLSLGSRVILGENV